MEAKASRSFNLKRMFRYLRAADRSQVGLNLPYEKGRVDRRLDNPFVGLWAVDLVGKREIRMGSMVCSSMAASIWLRRAVASSWTRSPLWAEVLDPFGVSSS